MESNQDFGSLLSNSSSGSVPPSGGGGGFGDLLRAPAPAPAPARPAPAGAPLDENAVTAVAEREGLNPTQRRVMAALLAQESSNGRNTATSVDGARGPGQIIPATFQRYAKPGETIDNGEHNLAVMARIVKDLGGKFGDDPARIATGYFSGDGNVNAGQGSAWKNDAADGNGKRVSSYVQDVVGRVGAAPQQAAAAGPDLGKAPKWADVQAKPEFQALAPEDQAKTKQAYFDYWIAPYAGDKRDTLRQQFLAASGAPAAQGPSFMDRLGQAVNEIRNPAPPRESVLQGRQMPAQPELETTSRVPVRPEVRKAFNAQWDAAKPEQRQALANREGWVGMLARERLGINEQLDQQIAATREPQQGLPGQQPDNSELARVREELARDPSLRMNERMLRSGDTRIEARLGRLTAKGYSPEAAQRVAEQAVRYGVAPGKEEAFDERINGTIKPSNFDFETKELFDREGGTNGLNNPLSRGLAKAGLGVGKTFTGYGEFLADVYGLDGASKKMREGGDFLRGKEAAIGESGNFLERNFEGAINSIAQQMPLMIAGVKGASQAIPLAGMALQTFGQEYSDGRAKGQSVGDATIRASLFSAFEVIGEKFGLGETLKAYKAAAQGLPSDQIVGFLWAALKKEVPGEVLTTTGQFSVDKFGGQGVALNPNATFEDYVKQVADTIAQTVMQSGITAGGTTGVSKAVQFLNEPKSDEEALGRAMMADLKDRNFTREAINEQVLRGMTPSGKLSVRPPDAGVPPTPQRGQDTQAPAITPPAALATNDEPPEPRGQQSGYSDEDVLEFAGTRLDFLMEKQAGTDEEPGTLTPTEQDELRQLQAAGDNLPKLRAVYGLDQSLPENPNETEQQTRGDGPALPQGPAGTGQEATTGQSTPAQQGLRQADEVTDPDADIPFFAGEGKSNESQEDAMRGMGFSEEEIAQLTGKTDAKKEAAPSISASDEIAASINERVKAGELTLEQAKDEFQKARSTYLTENREQIVADAFARATEKTLLLARQSVQRGDKAGAAILLMTGDTTNLYPQLDPAIQDAIVNRLTSTTNQNGTQAPQAQQTEAQGQEAPAAPGAAGGQQVASDGRRDVSEDLDYGNLTLEEFQQKAAKPYAVPNGVLTTDLTTLSDREVMDRFGRDDLVEVAKLLGSNVSGSKADILSGVRKVQAQRERMKNVTREQLDALPVAELRALVNELGGSGNYLNKSGLVDFAAKWRDNSLKNSRDNVAKANHGRLIARSVLAGNQNVSDENVRRHADTLMRVVDPVKHPQLYKRLIEKKADSLFVPPFMSVLPLIEGLREDADKSKDEVAAQKATDLADALQARYDRFAKKLPGEKPGVGVRDTSKNGEKVDTSPEPAQETAKNEQVDPEVEAKAKAQADLDAALGDLGDLLGKGTRLNIVPEQEQKLIPILTRVMDAAFRMGYYKFKDAARFVLKTIREKLGKDVEEQITLDHLQGAYIGMAGKYQADGKASSKREVIEVESVDELNDSAAPKVEEKSIEPVAEVSDLYTPEGKFKVAQTLAEGFVDGDGFDTIIEARKRIGELIGKKIEPGTELAKQADETIEVAVVLAAREIVESGRRRGRSQEFIYQSLVSLYGAQPNLAVRSSTSVREQAYSTPVPLAYLASELAGITYDSKVLEPTAGNGMLVIGAATGNVTANELNPRRAAMLSAMGFNATTENAAKEDLADPKSQDVVIANPPFGVTQEANGQTIIYEVSPSYGTREVDHAISFNALATMKDDGTAVLIVGGSNATSEEGRRDDYRGKSKRAFYFNLYQQYNVTDHFTVDGSLYSKQGASYPVDVIVIKGRGKSSRDLPAADLPQVIGSYDELKEKLNGTGSVGTQGVQRPDRTDSREDQAGQSDGARVVGSPVGQGQRTGSQGQPQGTASGVPSTGDAVDGRAEGSGAVSSPAQPRADAATGSEPDRGQPVSDDGGRAGRGSGGRPGTEPDRLGGASVVAGERVGSGLTDRRGEEQETSGQVAYEPHSTATSVGTLVPRAMRDAIDASLQKMEDQVGSLDEYVAQRLDMDPDTVRTNFSAEQVDALALAIKNAEEGRGFIIGDQTGIGKGRVVAAMIRYALVNGKVPIFVTEKPNLYADMIRDLDDIGMTDELALDTEKPRILMTNSKEPIPYTLLRTANGQVTESNLTLKSPKTGKALETLFAQMMQSESLGEYRVIFTTYNQLQTVKGKMTERMRLVQQFGTGNYMIFDESHNAGGAGPQRSRGSDKEEGEAEQTGRAGFVRGLVNVAYGTFFSSATYAKRPDVMDLYSSTNMKLAVDKISQLAEAIKNGGVPMQQVVANMLTTDGQYIRRERTFAGVSYDTVETKVDKETAENMASAMRAVLAFSRAKEAVIAAIQKEMDKEGAMVREMGGAKASIEGSNFGATMHNLIDQMLLSLKVNDSLRHAIERLKAGEKVVLTVSNTMGSFLKDYADEMGLSVGDPVALTFSDLYLRYLEKQRIVTIKDAGGNKTKRRLTDQELGPKLVEMYESIAMQIRDAGFGQAPISPIDFMHTELRKAGFKTDEITGRTATMSYEGGMAKLSNRKADIQQRLGAISGFNSGSIDVLILNQSGSTGLSLHANSKFKDQRKRHMIIVQAEKNIDTHMQMLGRVHRTGQVIAPAYSQMMADVPAEMRPAAVLLKKMASLNANTTASRTSSVTAEGVVDFMNDYGGQVVQEYLRDNPDTHEAIGGTKVIPLVEDSSEADEESIRKLTGYIPILPLKQQEEIYKDLIDRYNELLERENTLGTNKLEAKAIDLDAETVSTRQITDDKGDPSIFAAPANMERIDVKRTVKPFSSAEVTSQINESLGGKQANDVARDQLRDLNERAGKFIEERIAKLVDDGADPIKVEAQRNLLRMLLGNTQAVLNTYRIGQNVSIKDKLGMIVHGVITDIKAAKRTANPAAGSDWKMTIALANGDAKSLTIPFSQIASKYTVEQVFTVQWFNPETQATESIPPMAIFDKGATARREKRWIVTGNILAGFATFPGQIISYTRKDGTTGQGVLMSRQFDFEKEMDKQPVRLKTGAQALKFMTDFGGTVGTEDGVLRIMPARRGYTFMVPASKKQGGTYFLDRDLTRLLGGDFYKRGSFMSSTVYYADEALNALNYLIEQRQEPIVALTHTDKAKQMLAEAPPPQGTTNFSASRTLTSSPMKLSLQAVEQAVQAAMKRVPNAPVIEVFSDPAAAGLAVPAGIVPKGVTLPDGRVVIFSDNAESVLDVFQTVFHELFHRGSKVRFKRNADYIKAMLELAGADAYIRKLAGRWKASDDGQNKRADFQAKGPMTGDRLANYEALAVEEALAQVAEAVKTGELNSPRSTIERIAAAFAKLAERWGMKQLAGWLRESAYTGAEKFVLETIEVSGGAVNQGTNALLFSAPDSEPPVQDIVRRTQRNAMQFFGNKQNLRTFGLYDRSLSTQYNKALKDPHYGKVFAYANAMQNEVSLTSIRPAELAPGILRKVDDFRSATRALVMGAERDKGLKAATTALLAGTLQGDSVVEGKVWTEEELRNDFGLDDAAVALYQQARAAIDASLDEVAAAEAYAMAQGFIPKQARRLIIDNPQRANNVIFGGLGKAKKLVQAALAAAQKQGASDEKIESLQETLKSYEDTEQKVKAIFARASELKKAGYAPLMRFGDYTVTVEEVEPATGKVVRNEDGEPVVNFFSTFETQAEAIAKANELQVRYAGNPGVRVSKGVKSNEGYKLYAGISPETLALFAEAVGNDKVVREFYKEALSERSSLKRRLERKQIEGYSDDLPRILSNFITSNGRFAAQRYYMRDLNAAIKFIPRDKGDVKDEAIGLRDFIMNPNDPAAPVSALMFAWFLGGSVAAAVVNLSQPVLMTGPYLSQFGVGLASKAMAQALPVALGRKQITDADLRKALKRASQEGIVEAQEIFHLYSQGAQGVSVKLANTLSKLPLVGGKLKAGTEGVRARTEAFLTLWGMMFSVAESFNRKLTFVAAWQMAIELKVANPYAFAVRAVNETQGIYNKVNRPNWARGPVGRTVLTFKQFSLMYVELLKRMVTKGGPEGKRAAAMMLAMLILAAGEEGLPFMQDLDDLIDTIGQLLGYDTNMKRNKRQWAHEYLGKTGGDLLLYGVSSLLPLDFAGRLGLGNMVPGSALFKQSSEGNKLREVTEVVGPAGSLVQQVNDAYEAFTEGNRAKAMANLSPKAIKDLAAGTDMALTGTAKDTRGRKNMDVTLAEAAVKAIGFNPTKLADASRTRGPVMQDRALQKQTEAAIVDTWARGIALNDADLQKQAEQRLKEWNAKNPETPVSINSDQIRQAARQYLVDQNSRIIKSAPRELRGRIGLDLAK